MQIQRGTDRVMEKLTGVDERSTVLLLADGGQHGGSHVITVNDFSVNALV